MLVVFKRAWFAPSEAVRTGGIIRSISGQFFRKGTQEVPDNLEKFLPKDAKVVEKLEEEMKETINTLRDFDEVRAEGHELDRVNEETKRQLEIKEQRRESLSKGRKILAAKRKEEKENS